MAEPKKLLLVDDNREFLMYVRGMLTENGYEVHTANDWYNAGKLAYVNRGEYAVIISDMQLGEDRNHWGDRLLPYLKRLHQSQARTILISTEPVEEHPADTFIIKSELIVLPEIIENLLK